MPSVKKNHSVNHPLFEDIRKFFSLPETKKWEGLHVSVARALLPIHLGTLSGEIKPQIWLVDGDRIKIQETRSKKSHRGDEDWMDFVEGGNGNEDPALCPKHVCVVDWNVRPHDWPFICYHEVLEWHLMNEGKGYFTAHMHANEGEKFFRTQEYSNGQANRRGSFVLSGGVSNTAPDYNKGILRSPKTV